MELSNYSLMVSGLPLIKLSYHPLPGGGNGWLMYIKFEQPLTEEQQLQWQGLCPWTEHELRRLVEADPLRIRMERLEDMPFKVFWDAYRQYNNAGRAEAEKVWKSMSKKERKLAVQFLPDFVKRKIKSEEKFPYGVRYLRNKVYHDFLQV